MTFNEITYIEEELLELAYLEVSASHFGYGRIPRSLFFEILDTKDVIARYNEQL